jgi:2-polyprenyl-3-methyl-5-hydroxy-6-metoxy-1,4-benzoquinol methylase
MNEGAHYRYHAPGFCNPSVQVGLERLLQRVIAEIAGANRVCDLGCGNGRFALALMDLGFRVVGVDGSHSGIDVARTMTGGRVTQFICANIDKSLPELVLSSHAPFDVVVSCDVIEHMFTPGVLIDVAHRLLRPGGTFVLATPYHGYAKNLAIGVFNKWDAHHGVHWDGGHIKFFSVRTLKRMVLDHGFEHIRFRFFGRVAFLWKNMICIARKPAAAMVA